MLFLNRSFWPDPEATGQFLTELCDDLSAAHRITVIAGPPLYRAVAQRALLSRDRRGDIEIIRTFGTRFSKTRLAGRLTNLATYYMLAALAARRLECPDIIIAATDPPLLGALGAMLKRRFGCRLVYNVRDLYPDIAYANGALKNPALLTTLRHANAFAYAHSDAIVTLGHDMAERIIAKGVPAAKVSVIPDWVDTTRIHPLACNPFRAEFGDRFVVMYSGNIGLSQQLESVLDAAAMLAGDTRIVFLLIGEGARKPALMKLARERGLANVKFLPYRPKEELAQSLGAADLHLIPLMPGAAGCLVPSKIYAILAAGRPFVAMMEPGAEVARIALEHRVGFVVEPGDAVALARTIAGTAEDRDELRAMGLRARALAVNRFDRGLATRAFAAMLARVGEMA
ncbi:MAG TPA: glycosyltransferase family 4 protein [Candidatus Binataceae bacterium]|nr:glycosyltransferase family 4 protein [Candidatus Binataceae bacterium]